MVCIWRLYCHHPLSAGRHNPVPDNHWHPVWDPVFQTFSIGFRSLWQRDSRYRTTRRHGLNHHEYYLDHPARVGTGLNSPVPRLYIWHNYHWTAVCHPAPENDTTGNPSFRIPRKRCSLIRLHSRIRKSPSLHSNGPLYAHSRARLSKGGASPELPPARKSSKTASSLPLQQ